MVDNFETDWSGSGWSSNEVLNEINSIPDVKPPKFSTTGAKPRKQSDVNGVVEGDFHYHNNIESVQVDDFYYDYNFINFHEDLSDDFEDDGIDSGDRNSVNASTKVIPTGSTVASGSEETTIGPKTATVCHTATKVKEQRDKDVGGNGGDGVNESETGSVNSEDFLSEDFLLPAFTTRSPSLLSTRKMKEKENEDPLPSESTATTPRLTTEDPTLTLEKDIERETKLDLFPQHRVTAPPTLGYDVLIHTAVKTKIRDQEKEEPLGGDDSHRELPDVGSHGPDLTTHLQLDISKIPQTTSQSLMRPATFTPVHSNLDLTKLVLSTIPDPQSSRDLRNSPPPSEKLFPAPTSPRRISGKEEDPRESATTGTEVEPPTVLDGATETPPLDSSPALVPPLEKTESNTADQPSATPTTLKPSQTSTTPLLHTAPPTYPPDAWPLRVTSTIQTPASTQVVISAYWVTGNWSTVSSSFLHILHELKAVSYSLWLSDFFFF